MGGCWDESGVSSLAFRSGNSDSAMETAFMMKGRLDSFCGDEGCFESFVLSVCREVKSTSSLYKKCGIERLAVMVRCMDSWTGVKVMGDSVCLVVVRVGGG